MISSLKIKTLTKLIHSFIPKIINRVFFVSAKRRIIISRAFSFITILNSVYFAIHTLYYSPPPIINSFSSSSSVFRRHESRARAFTGASRASLFLFLIALWFIFTLSARFTFSVFVYSTAHALFFPFLYLFS